MAVHDYTRFPARPAHHMRMLHEPNLNRAEVRQHNKNNFMKKITQIRTTVGQLAWLPAGHNHVACILYTCNGVAQSPLLYTRAVFKALIRCFGPIDQPSFQPVTLNVLPALLTVTVRSHMPGKVAVTIQNNNQHTATANNS